MIVVDSSVWIAHLRSERTPAREKLLLLHPGDILVGDLILMEVLMGARTGAHAARIEKNLRSFPVAPMLGEDLAVQAAAHYRTLRAKGVTIRKTNDMIIAAFCITGGHQLLHQDRDFDVIAAHLPLRVV